jgi:hypothetical protein
MNKEEAIVDYLFSNGFKMSAHVGEASNFEESQMSLERKVENIYLLDNRLCIYMKVA